MKIGNKTFSFVQSLKRRDLFKRSLIRELVSKIFEVECETVGGRKAGEKEEKTTIRIEFSLRRSWLRSSRRISVDEEKCGKFERDFGCYFIVTELCRRENHINGRRDRIISLRINLTILEEKKKKKKRKRTTKAFIRERRDCKRPDNVWSTHTPGISENSYRSARAFRHLALLTIIRGPIRWPKRRSRYYAIMFHESSRNFLSLFLSFLLSFLSVVSFFFCPARCLTREKYTECSLSFSLFFVTSTHFAKH